MTVREQINMSSLIVLVSRQLESDSAIKMQALLVWGTSLRHSISQGNGDFEENKTQLVEGLKWQTCSALDLL